jgi:hypothetical protein
VAEAINAEKVVPAHLLPDGRIILVVGAGYGRDEQRQIVLAVAKVWHGLCEVHTPLINAVEAASCPLPPRVAAWPPELEGPVIRFLGAAVDWVQAGRPETPGLLEALQELEALASGV